MEATRRVVGTLLRETKPTGLVRSYYERLAGDERTLRQEFASLIVEPTEKAVISALGTVSRLYPSRCPNARLPIIGRTLLQRVAELGWWSSQPPSLFSSDDATSSWLSAQVPAVLRAIPAAPKGERSYTPYVLLTKFLHFAFPENFPICDSQASASVQVWSYFAFKLADRSGDRFTYRVLTDVKGAGYAGVVAFYRLLWDAICADERAALSASAEDINTFLGTSGNIGGKVTVIDLVDKLLWLANGDPRRLGLIELTHK